MTADDEAKAKRQADLAYWRAQAALSDEDILKAYCDGVRSQAASQIKGIEQAIANEAADEAYMKKYGTDEG